MNFIRYLVLQTMAKDLAQKILTRYFMYYCSRKSAVLFFKMYQMLLYWDWAISWLKSKTCPVLISFGQFEICINVFTCQTSKCQKMLHNFCTWLCFSIAQFGTVKGENRQCFESLKKYFQHMEWLLKNVIFFKIVFLQDVVQQNNTLIEEMLYLIIMIVGKFRMYLINF